MVYVDNAKIEYGQMFMFHMIADSTEELNKMADTIRVSRKHIQNKGKYNEHFDICLSKKKLALAAGAKEISSRELVAILKQRPGHPGNLKSKTV
jgi:hypothetical protein